MKTLKLALAAVFALAMVTSAMADGVHAKPKKVYKCTIEKAIRNPELVKEMYKQLDEEMLNNNQQEYVGRVHYDGTLWLISGKYWQWKRFFSMKWKYYVETNTFGIQSR